MLETPVIGTLRQLTPCFIGDRVVWYIRGDLEIMYGDLAVIVSLKKKKLELFDLYKNIEGDEFTMPISDRVKNDDDEESIILGRLA